MKGDAPNKKGKKSASKKQGNTSATDGNLSFPYSIFIFIIYSR
jgi:hypothetical protein